MQRHLVDKPGLHCSERSSAMDAGKGIVARPLAALALFALVGLTLDSLGLAILWVDEAAFERYCRVVDGSGFAAILQLIICLGPAVWLLAEDGLRIWRDARLEPRRRSWLVLHGLALAAIAGYVLLLRLPWITQHANARARLDLWSARLSGTFHGVPLVGFLLTVGAGTWFVAVGAAALRAIDDSGFTQKRGLTQRFAAGVWLVCGVDCALQMLTLIMLATGGLF